MARMRLLTKPGTLLLTFWRSTPLQSNPPESKLPAPQLPDFSVAPELTPARSSPLYPPTMPPWSVLDANDSLLANRQNPPPINPLDNSFPNPSPHPSPPELWRR